MEKDIKNYFKEVYSIYSQGDYTEWTYRTPFENLIKGLNPDYNLTQEPKRAAGLGAPDFKAFYNNRKIGFIETKDLGENLDKILETDQLKKYIESIDNLILTNYLQFVLIRKGRKVYDCDLFMLSDLDKRNLSISKEKIETFASLINEFFEYKLPTIVLAEELAVELSKRAKLLKELAKDQLLNDLEKIKNNESPSSIYDFYLGIKELIKDVKLEDCADAYAQTITYGLFLAKKSCRGKLDRRTASYYIPRNVGVIKRIFLNISGEEFPPNISWIVDDIIDILNAAKLDEILIKIDKRGKKDKDPIIFFYEDFLNYYEPEKRKHLGVYYTPRPVVNFIVNSVHSILKKHFDKSLGLADDSVNVLDPAIGTGTFFWITFLVALGELKNQGLRGIIFDKIENHLLKHFYGFEILITPYVISHLKITDLLQRWHYRFKDDDRIQVYLTNTLEQSEVHDPLLFMREITEESRIANQIKTEKPILVVMGNPPYSGISVNKGKWIDDLLKKGYIRADGSKDDGYYKVDGKPLDEKNPKWLQDDYVKFIRYAQWKIDQNGEGVVGFITNHSYLDNPTFRGMRESLLQSFDRIFILNLHGNSLKKEKCPDGSKDENVFDIQQGVAIGIFIKNKNLREKKIYYTDLWGLREDKYHWLDRHTIDNVNWQEVKPISPFYFFVPKDTTLEEEYNKFWKVTDIFPLNGVGMTTARDNFVIDMDKSKLEERMRRFKHSDNSDEELHSSFNIRKKKGWSIRKAWNMLQPISDSDLKKYIKPVFYRPFDVQWIFWHDSVVWRTVKRVMKHMLKENLGLITVRQVAEGIFNHAYVTNTIIESRITLSNKGIAFLFPLYLYSDFEKKANIDPNIYKTLSEKYNKELTPEDIFYYIYAILYSPTYRKRYEEFLQYDFPRIPFVDDYEDFTKLAELGKELVELHLMRKRLPTSVKFDVIGSNIVEKVKYENGKVWINKEQYFDGVPGEIWNFYIGGYQVLDKWLKSRKNRKLESKDIEQFLQIVEIIRETIRLMKEIDKFNIP
ncbi:N-6 DNA methylase [Petrotoga sp. HWHPT.55.6.3]|nr:N-6 DNA methylase [Petrotoga sp. HWHPT.55.6.3]